MEFCKTVNTEPMLAVNMGTGTIQDAANLVEYCNAPRRHAVCRSAGRAWLPQPHGVKYWCVGNEMDGPWQIGHLEAEEYGKKAREAAKMMRWHDPSIQLVPVRLFQQPHADLPRMGSHRAGTVLGAGRLPFDALLRRQSGMTIPPVTWRSALNLRTFVDTLTGVLRYVKAKTPLQA